MQWQLIGERRALSLLLLGFYTSVFFIVGLSMGGAWAKCFFALTAVYGVGFFALASGWFWARWYSQGLGVSGITIAVIGLVTSGWNLGLAIWGLMHLLIYLPLLGEGMADLYENRPEWRERYGMDEYGVARLKRAVKSAATALPTLVLYTLAPRPDTDHLILFGLAALAGLGFWGLIRMRFWGVAALAIAGALTAFTVGSDASTYLPFSGGALDLANVGLLAVAALAFAISPFVIPAYRWMKRDE